VACEFLNSDAVFVGTVISFQTASPPGASPGWQYDLTVQRLFRGPHTRTIQVFTENSSGRFPLDVGKRYLIFAYYTDEWVLEIDNCGNSSLLSTAGPALRELRKLQIPKDAVIEGNISFFGSPDTVAQLEGIRVTVRSSTTRSYAVSDRDGWFHLHVPPGIYSAEVEQVPNLKIAPWGLTEDPSYFEARSGRCVGLRFDEK
jgi:hypothetical protein